MAREAPPTQQTDAIHQEPDPGTPSTRRRWSLTRLDTTFSPYVYISPFFILFAIFGLFPIGYTGWIAVHDWSLIGGQGDFVGLNNFTDVLGRDEFWVALRNTLSIFVIHMIPHLVFALAIAAALDRRIRAATFWRMSVLVPFIVTPVAVALIFNSLFADKSGLINNLLGSIGIDPIAWHVGVLPSHIAIAAMVDFRVIGYSSLILLAGMQAIPRDYYEAATMDGASPLRQFFSITIPQLRSTIIFVVVTSTIAGLQIFDQPRLYDTQGSGGSDNQWLTLSLYMYNLGFDDLDFGKASAVAWLLFLIIMIISLLNLLVSRMIASSEGRKQR
jgi:cellobiose transport system permease protein